MLYVTTRSKFDAYTTPRAVAADRASDGGFYLPLRLPCYEKEQILALGENSFGQNVAEVLNRFFSCRLTGWDVEFTVGRYPAQLQSLGHRLLIGEVWHNLDNHFSATEKALADRIGAVGSNGEVTSWVKIAIRIAFLFGLFGQMQKNGMGDPEQLTDVAVPTGDFVAPMAAWYARQMGLPIGNIICCCNDNSGIWDLFTHGQLRTDVQTVKTKTPLADISLPEELERLIFATLGLEEVTRFLEVCRARETYCPKPEQLIALRKGMAATVVSDARVEVMIPRTYRSNDYVLDPYTALAFAGLTDYRAKTGESRQTLIVAERSPVLDSDTVCQMMRISPETLNEILHRL